MVKRNTSADVITKEIIARCDLYNRLNGDYHHNIKVLIPMNTKYEWLAEQLDTSVSSINRLLGPCGKPNTQLLIKLCLLLEFDRDISAKLLESAGKALNPGDKKDKFVILVLSECPKWTYTEKVEYLQKNKIFSK